MICGKARRFTVQIAYKAAQRAESDAFQLPAPFWCERLPVQHGARGVTYNPRAWPSGRARAACSANGLRRVQAERDHKTRVVQAT